MIRAGFATSIGGALSRAVPILFTARIVGLAVLPLVVAAVVWTGIAVAGWHPLTDALTRIFGASTLSRIAADVIAVLMFAALAAATALTAIAVLAGLSERKHVLVVAQRGAEMTWKSLRNAERVHLLYADQLNTYDVLVSDDVVFTRGALDDFVAGPVTGRSAKGSATEAEAQTGDDA